MACEGISVPVAFRPMPWPVRRSLVERVTLAAVRERLSSREHLAYVLQRVRQELVRASSTAPEILKNKQAEFEQEERRLANLINFVAEGQESKALAQAPQIAVL
jgi:hypothetical protein